jgi:hypothetical protein
MSGFVFTYGRFNPPTKGHGLLFREIVSRAEKMGAKPVIVVSHSNASKKNPLSAEDKMAIIKQVFPNVDVRASGPGNQIGDIVKQLIVDYGKPGVMLVGSDRVKGMAFMKMYGINIAQAGETRTAANSSAAAVTSLKNISGTRTRAVAMRQITDAYNQAQKRKNFRFQYILGNTLSSPNINNTMRLLARKISNLPNKTPPRPKSAPAPRAKSVPPPTKTKKRRPRSASAAPVFVPLIRGNRRTRGVTPARYRNNYTGKNYNEAMKSATARKPSRTASRSTPLV